MFVDLLMYASLHVWEPAVARVPMWVSGVPGTSDWTQLVAESQWGSQGYLGPLIWSFHWEALKGRD